MGLLSLTMETPSGRIPDRDNSQKIDNAEVFHFTWRVVFADVQQV